MSINNNKTKRLTSRLPREIGAPTTRGRLVVTIAIALILVFLANYAAGVYLYYYTPNTGYLLIKEKWNILRTLTGPVDLVVLGDSSGNQGVDPEAITRELDLSGINFCTIGDASLLNDLWLLKDYVRLYGPPKAVLLVHGYHTWVRGINLSLLPKIPVSWERREPELHLKFNQRVRLMINRFVPLYAETRALTHTFKYPWKTFRRKLALEANGFMKITESRPDRVVADYKRYLALIKDQQYDVSRTNMKALSSIINLARAHEFDVFIVTGPYYRGLCNDTIFQQCFANVRKTIDSVDAANKHVYTVFKTPLMYSEAEMQSVDHITAKAAEDFTIRLARNLDSLWQIR